MKNIKDRIKSRAEAIDEASGFGKTMPSKKSDIDKMKAAGDSILRKGPMTYEEDFDELVTSGELEKKLEQLKKDYKKAKSSEEKMKILKKQTEVRAKLAEMK